MQGRNSDGVVPLCPLSSPDALCRLGMQVDETIYSPTQAYPTEDTFYEIELETVCPSCCALLRSAMLRHVGCSATVACSSTAEGPVDAFVWVHLRCVTIHPLCGLHMFTRVSVQPLTCIASSRSVAHSGGQGMHMLHLFLASSRSSGPMRVDHV